MNTRELIWDLHCPHCAVAMSVESEIETSEGDLRSGLLRCACTTHPVLEGIVCIDRRTACGRFSPFDPAVDRLRAGDARGALASMLAPFGRHFMGRATALFQRLERRPPEPVRRAGEAFIRRRILENAELSFARGAALLRNECYSDYLIHRFANPSMLAAVAVLLMLKELPANRRGPVVMDLGGGTGHISYLISRFFPSASVVLADHDFAVLYLARRFIAPQAVCICTDAESPLPLADSALDAVFSVDCFHYVQSKAALSAELLRVLKPEGLLLLSHLHNAKAQNPTAGIPLAPEVYARCFAGIPHLLLDERRILEDLMNRGVLDLRGDGGDDPADAPALCMIGSRRDRIWREHDLSPLLCRSRDDLALNPLYTVHEDGAVAHLRSAWPSESLERECTASGPTLPDQIDIPRHVLDRLRSGRLTPDDDEAIEPLLRSFTLVPLPRGYR